MGISDLIASFLQESLEEAENGVLEVQRSDLAQPFCHVRNPFLRQGEPVKQPFRHAAAASGFQILCIFCKNVCCVRFKTFCRCKQRRILGIRIKPGKDVAGCFCLLSDFFQISHL